MGESNCRIELKWGWGRGGCIFIFWGQKIKNWRFFIDVNHENVGCPPVIPKVHCSRRGLCISTLLDFFPQRAMVRRGEHKSRVRVGDAVSIPFEVQMLQPTLSPPETDVCLGDCWLKNCMGFTRKKRGVCPLSIIQKSGDCTTVATLLQLLFK